MKSLHLPTLKTLGLIGLSFLLNITALYATELYDAAKKNDIKTVKTLIAQSVDINDRCRNSPQWTPLQIAIYEGHTRIVQLLIENGANVNQATNISLLQAGPSPLSLAIAHGRYAILKLLINAGANLEERQAAYDIQTPLGSAFFKICMKYKDENFAHYFQILIYLLAQGVAIKSSGAEQVALIGFFHAVNTFFQQQNQQTPSSFMRWIMWIDNVDELQMILRGLNRLPEFLDERPLDDEPRRSQHEIDKENQRKEATVRLINEARQALETRIQNFERQRKIKNARAIPAAEEEVVEPVAGDNEFLPAGINADDAREDSLVRRLWTSCWGNALRYGGIAFGIAAKRHQD